jgi:hypothetical protein
MQIEDKRKAKAKLQAMCISYAERNSSIRFCKLLGQCPSIELRYEWVKPGIEKVGMDSVPTCIHVLKSLKFRLLPKNHPSEWRLG